jgi:hypothetical protein
VTCAEGSVWDNKSSPRCSLYLSRPYAHGIAGDEPSPSQCCSVPAMWSHITRDRPNCCHSISLPTNSTSTCARCGQPSARADSTRTSRSSPCLAGHGDWPRAPPPSSSWLFTTAGSAARRSVRRPCRRFRPTTINSFEPFAVGSGSRRTAWLDASARPARPSCTSGSHGSERRRRSSGNRFSGCNAMARAR